jgi:L-lactate dehydrogenase complex protein LldE
LLPSPIVAEPRGDSFPRFLGADLTAAPERPARVALFVTCLADVFFPDGAADAVRLLRSLGVTVDFPSGQTCCGQPAYNSGHMEEAREMTFRTRAVFREFEHVVLPSGSCAAMVRHFAPRLLGEREDGHGNSSGKGPRYWELSEFIVHALGVTRLGDGLAGVKIAYHHGCHALRELGIRNEPLALLEAAGAELVPWEAAEECCGFGGLFSVKLPEVSAAMADRKLDTLPEVDVLTSADGGCLMQLAGRMERKRRRTSALPLASLLWRATGPSGGAAEPRGLDALTGARRR